MENNYIIIGGQLQHVGIKGMKWGVRRYQNKDGSLTPEGKKRYANAHDDYLNAHSKKSVESMSDKELRDRINRVRMENEYKQFTSATAKGKKLIGGFITTAGLISGVMGAYATYKKVGNGALDKIGDWVVKDIKIGRLD